MIGDELSFELEVVVFVFGVFFEGVDLEEETLGDVAGADAGGFEGLDEAQGLVDVVEGEWGFGFGADGFEVGAEVALFVDVVDDGFTGLADGGGGIR
jgi:hypothetical protein